VNGTLSVVYARSFSADAATLEIEGWGDGSQIRPPPKTDRTIKADEVSRLRNMGTDEILAKLKADVSRLASVPVDAIEKDAPLVTMLDSLTLSQLKGLLENGYAVTLSDEYLFRESTTVQKLADVCKLGYAPDDVVGGAGEGAQQQPHAPPSSIGQATGLAGALGCPPGVVCVVL
jgi:acyl carrier protein